MHSNEQHLLGKSITVVYKITDPVTWRQKNPLQYTHDGLEAYCVSIGDLSQRRDELRAALDRISQDCIDRVARRVAQDALDADDRTG